MALPRLEASKDCDMKKKLLVLLFSLASLALVACGGGNDGASTGTPVVAQATVWSPYANGGCGKSSSWGGTGPALTQSQQTACTNAILGLPWSGYNTYNLCEAMGWTIASFSATQYQCASNGSLPNCVIPSQAHSVTINRQLILLINGC